MAIGTIRPIPGVAIFLFITMDWGHYYRNGFALPKFISQSTSGS
jgi:hypothetical protein